MLSSEISSIFDYEDGNLIWKIGRNKGKTAGYLNTTGYKRVTVKNKSFAVHRLIYILFNKESPKYIDHIDGNPLNNKIENLRKCTASQNQYNRGLSKNNKSGVKGVRWDSQYRKWRAMIGIENKYVHIGRYETIEQAKEAIEQVRKEQHKEFAKHE